MYRVIWVPAALNELTAAWVSADSHTRTRITAAVNALDVQLRATPLEAGESRGRNRRVALIAPLGVEFEIDEPEQTVWVWRVWRFIERT